MVVAYGAAPVPVRPNLIVNGGFETWTAFAPGIAERETVGNLQLLPPDQTPDAWEPGRELARGQAPTAILARDGRVKHGGAFSVRIENRAMQDITYIGYSAEPFSGHTDDPHRLRPNRRYLLRWWVKGEAVSASGTGPLMMMFVMSREDGQWVRTNDHERDPVPTGTFDWQQRQFVFVTDEHAQWARFTFQLRWTMGTIWYDDVELLDTGPVVAVETY